MDLYPRVMEMRQRALDWFASMQAPEQGFGVHADSAYHQQNGPAGMYLPGTYNATHCLFLLGAYDDITPEQADSLAGFLNKFQREDGVYRIPEVVAEEVYYPDFEYIDLHTSNYTLGALGLLGRKPRHSLRFMTRYDTAQKLAAWLEARKMTEPWTEGNYIVNLASFYAYLLGQGDEQYRPLLEQLLDWHETHQDPDSGYWYDPVTQDLTSAMAGATHNLHLYYSLSYPVPRYKMMVDHCLSILEGVTSACLDIDVVDILANLYVCGYRQGEIEDYLERKLVALLDYQNPDGGFADVREGVRLFDGWERYQEPQGMSNTFATWFRTASVGMICYVLYPEQRHEWRFRNTLGMGFFGPHLPSREKKKVEIANVQKKGTAASDTTRSATLGEEGQNLLRRIEAKLASADPESLKAAEAVFQIEISGQDGGSVSIAITDGVASVKAGDHPDARVWLTMAPKTLDKLLDGNLNATIAYMTKKLKVRGDIALAMKLESLLR